MSTSTIAEYLSFVFWPYLGPIAGFVLAVLALLAVYLAFRTLIGDSDS